MIRTLVLATLGLAGLTSTAPAHFDLTAPKADRTGDPAGKAPPCGDTGTPTGAVTNYMPGQTITITVDETISHPGHYRVALAQNMAALPPEPLVTAGATPCGSAPIAANPTFPVLADGLFTNLVRGPASAQVQLPAGMTCTNCVLQVIQFMSDHALNVPGGCYYHHCAIVNISATAPDAGAAAPPDAGVTGGDAGTNPGGATSGGCAAGHSVGGLSIVGMLAVLLVTRRRRR
jgi:uncharacterized protein (TIGR03382 family)